MAIFRTTFGAHVGAHFGTRSAQEGGKMSPRGPSRAPKSQKAAFSKTLKNFQFLKVFGVQRPPKRASRGPRRLSRGTQRAPKPPKKWIQKLTHKSPSFGPILEQFWRPFWSQNLFQKGTKNGTTRRRPQESPKTAQDKPKIVQDRPKIAQDTPKMAQDRHKIAQSCSSRQQHKKQPR